MNTVNELILDKYFSGIKRGLDHDALKDFSSESKLKLSAPATVSFLCANTMIERLFKLDGLFYKDINNLDEFRFEQLLQIQLILFCTKLWPAPLILSPASSYDNIIFILEIFLSINRSVSSVYLNGLIEQPRLEDLMFYRWCMLAVGHTDIYYEEMHENSPDCKKFIEIMNLSKEEVKKRWDKMV